MADETGASGSSASAAGSSPAPSTAASSTPAAPPASATATPATATSATPDASSVQSGEPPKERWDSILSNARAKTRAEVEAEYKTKYGKYDQFETDPWGAVQAWLDQASQHSLYSDHVTNYAAKLLNSRRGKNQPQAAEEPQPDVPIFNGQGQQTGATYSAERMKQWREWDWQQKQAELSQRLQPLEEMRSNLERQAQLAQAQQEAESWGRSTLESLRQNPVFKEHEAKVKQALIDHEEWGDNVHAAFNHVLTTEILPKLSQTEQQKVVDSLEKKATGATVNPGSTAVSQAPKFKTMGEALRYFHEHQDEAKAVAER